MYVLCKYIHNIFVYTQIYYVNKLLFWMQLMAINCLTALNISVQKKQKKNQKVKVCALSLHCE